MLASARSLIPKLESLSATADELKADIVALTETWLQHSANIDQILCDFTDKTDYAFIRRDRTGGKRGGGVAIAFNRKMIDMTRVKLPPSKHELVAAIGRRHGQ